MELRKEEGNARENYSFCMIQGIMAKHTEMSLDT